jgi:hypothetical protein
MLGETGRASCLVAPGRSQQQPHHLHKSMKQSAGFDHGLRKARVVCAKKRACTCLVAPGRSQQQSSLPPAHTAHSKL